MEKLSYKLEAFEGPLDLLLHLIAKNKLNIFEIEIALLLEQYLKQMEEMQRRDMAISSEFLEMAARLVHIKTVSLLPKHEEAEELQKELSGQLIEYRIYKQAAREMLEAFCMDSFIRPPMKLERDHSYRLTHEPQELLEAYRNAVGRGKRFLPPPVERFSGIVSRRIVSVTSQIIAVLRRLRTEKQLEYAQLFAGKEEKSEMVATFLAVLELVKGKRIRVEDQGMGSMVILQEENA